MAEANRSKSMRVLLIEDDRELGAHVQTRLEKLDHAVVHAIDDADGAARAIDGDFDVVILDWMLPKMDGIEALKRMRGGGVLAPVLMLTARGTQPTRTLPRSRRDRRDRKRSAGLDGSRITRAGFRHGAMASQRDVREAQRRPSGSS